MFQTPLLNQISKSFMLVLWSIYLTVGVVKWATALCANVPLFDTCNLYKDGDECYNRYLVWLGITAVYMIMVNVTDFAKTGFHS
jgi:hypothetical protein